MDPGGISMNFGSSISDMGKSLGLNNNIRPPANPIRPSVNTRHTSRNMPRSTMQSSSVKNTISPLATPIAALRPALLPGRDSISDWKGTGDNRCISAIIRGVSSLELLSTTSISHVPSKSMAKMAARQRPNAAARSLVQTTTEISTTVLLSNIVLTAPRDQCQDVIGHWSHDYERRRDVCHSGHQGSSGNHR